MKQQNKSSLYVAILTFISRIFGLLRVSFIGAYFGADNVADILNRILTIPNNLRKIFAEGSLSNAYMSIFKVTVQNSLKKNTVSQSFFSELLFYMGSITLVVTVLLALFSSHITAFLFQWNSIEDQQTAATLFIVVIPFLFFITLSVILSGLLQTHKRFALVAISPVLHSVCVIGSIFFFHNTAGIMSVAIGFLFGAFIQLLLLSIALSRMGYAIVPRLQSFFPSEKIKAVFFRYVPSIIAVLLTVISQQIIFYLSSTLEVGDSSSLGYAIVFWQLPIGVIIHSINSVAFVYLISAYEDKRMKALKECITHTVQNLCILLVPIAILFFFYAHAGVALALQRGKLDADSAYLVSKIVRAYGASLPLLGCYLFLQRVFYALLKYTLVLFYISIFSIIDLVLSFILVNTDLGIEGIAYAYGIALACVIPFMYLSISGYISLSMIIEKGMRILIASLPLALLSYVLSAYTDKFWFEGATWISIVLFVCICIVSLLFIWGGYTLVGIDIFSVLKTRKKVNPTL